MNTDKVSKDGHRVTVTEYECREINADGDCVNVEHYGTKAEAVAAAQLVIDHKLAVAAVVEKHVSHRPTYGEGDVFTTLAVFGEKEVLKLWGWQPGESTWLED